jgi:hypothetical protein
MIAALQAAMEATKARLSEERNAARRQSAFLRRCRNEATAARVAFEQDVRRRQAFFDSAERQRLRREAEKAQRAEEQQHRSHQPGVGYGEAAFGSPLPPARPSLIRTPQQERAYDAFEVAYASFEAAAADEPLFGLGTLPWPPPDCPASGARQGESAETRKHRLKAALLRWHPDKFEASHGGKLLDSQREAVMERVCAVLRRVQEERNALQPADSEGGSATQPSTPQPARAQPQAAPRPPRPHSSAAGQRPAYEKPPQSEDYWPPRFHTRHAAARPPRPILRPSLRPTPGLTRPSKRFAQSPAPQAGIPPRGMRAPTTRSATGKQ